MKLIRALALKVSKIRRPTCKDINFYNEISEVKSEKGKVKSEK